MRVLWDAGEATVAEVRSALSDERDRALTTIATMLSKLEKRGVVAHRTEGRQFVYRPLVSEAAVTRSMVQDLTNRVFDGDASALVSHLLSEHEIDSAELARLKSLLRERAEDAEEEEGA